MNSIEAAAFGLGLINVVLAVRRRVSNFPFAIGSVSLYAAVFFEVRLYSDAALQLFFVAANLYGWIAWTRSAAARGEVVVERLSAAARRTWAVSAAGATIAWAAAMQAFTDASYPWWDAAIAGTSVVAQLLMARRKLENWVLWIAVDLAAIGLYAAKELWLTMLLYLIFLGLAIAGLIDWRRAERRQHGTVAA